MWAISCSEFNGAEARGRAIGRELADAAAQIDFYMVALWLGIEVVGCQIEGQVLEDLTVWRIEKIKQSRIGSRT